MYSTQLRIWKKIERQPLIIHFHMLALQRGNAAQQVGGTTGLYPNPSLSPFDCRQRFNLW